MIVHTLHILCALMPYVPRCLTCFRVSCASYLTCSRVTRGFLTCFCALLASYRKGSCAPRTLLSSGVSYATDSHAYHVLQLSYLVSLVFFIFQLFFFFFYPSATVNQHGIKFLLKKSCYISFFIGDISLQDPLTYDDLTVLIYQPEFVR